MLSDLDTTIPSQYHRRSDARGSKIHHYTLEGRDVSTCNYGMLLRRPSIIVFGYFTNCNRLPCNRYHRDLCCAFVHLARFIMHVQERIRMALVFVIPRRGNLSSRVFTQHFAPDRGMFWCEQQWSFFPSYEIPRLYWNAAYFYKSTVYSSESSGQQVYAIRRSKQSNKGWCRFWSSISSGKGFCSKPKEDQKMSPAPPRNHKNPNEY